MNNRSTKLNLLIVILLVGCTAAYTLITNRHALFINAASQQTATAKKGHAVPDVSLTDIDGNTTALSAYKGKMIILNFWASWCPPCIAEFPALLNLAAAFPDDVVLIALSGDHDEEMMNRFLTRLKKEQGAKAAAPNVIIARDANQSIIQPVFQTTRLPETILITPDFVMQDKIVGAVEWDGENMKSKIRRYISETR